MSRNIDPTQYLLAALLWMAALHLLWPVTTLVPAPWPLLGLIGLAIVIGINPAAHGTLQAAGAGIKPDAESTALVICGVYRISRNPMYFGCILALAGIAGLPGSLTPWIVVVLFGIAADRVFIVAEECKFSARFGAPWREYASNTRRRIGFSAR